MGGKASKNKGKAFESAVCKFLNETYNTEEFKRTPSSGALLGKTNWGHNQGLEEHTKNVLSADIIAPSWFKCSIECKWYADKPSYHNIIKKNDTQLDKWLAETMRDSINTKRLPVLFFKTNQKGTFVALPHSFLNVNKIKLTHYSVYNNFIIIGLEHFNLIKDELLDIRESDCINLINTLKEDFEGYFNHLTELGM